MVLHILDSVPSTNQYCELLDLSQVEEFVVFAAHEQTAGIGQQGNHWVSAPGENLTGSIILKPLHLPVAHQFKLTQAVSLAVADFLRPYLPGHEHEIQIKWPNDIYVGRKKICGILISNKIKGSHMWASVVGIGLNVNQMEFPDWVPNPVSIRQITGEAHAPDILWASLTDAVRNRYTQLMQPNAFLQIEHDYLQQLMNYQHEATYLYKGETINATIQGVNQYGHLQLSDANGIAIECQLQEIKLIW